MDLLSSISVQQHLLPPVIFFAMLAVGMELRIAQFQQLLAEPKTPLLGTLIHTLTFPALAVSAVSIVVLTDTGIAEATILGVLLIAACPSGGFSNVLTMIARANLPLSVVLTAVSSILSFLSVPLLITGFGFFVTELEGGVSLPVKQILVQLGILVLLPVTLGMWMGQTLRRLTGERITQLQNISQIILYLTVAAMIAESWEVMVSGFADALPWSAGLCVSNIAACYFLSKLAGLRTEDSITVALEGSIRNLGVAFLIAANTLNRPDIAVFPTVYFLSVLIFSILFAKNWRKIPYFS